MIFCPDICRRDRLPWRMNVVEEERIADTETRRKLIKMRQTHVDRGDEPEVEL